MWFVD